MYGLDVLCEISKATFEIPHKISYPYIERDDFYLVVKIQELSHLRARRLFITESIGVQGRIQMRFANCVDEFGIA